MNNTQFKQILLDTEIFIDNIYLEKYIQLICDNINTQKEKNITQAHHIIPKYYFKHRNIKIDNSKNNLVNLKFTNHILAHYYLALCSKNEEDRISNEAALNRMVGGKRKHLDEIKDEDFNEYEQLYLEYNKKNSNCHKGTHHTTSEETKQKISIANKNRYKDYKSIYLDEKTEKKVHISELDNYLSNGWKLGRCTKSIYGLSKGYNYNSKGMLNKKQSQKQKDAVSKALKGVTKSPEAKNNMSKAKLGKVLYSNEVLNKSMFINKDEINIYENLGYHKGRLKSN